MGQAFVRLCSRPVAFVEERSPGGKIGRGATIGAGSEDVSREPKSAFTILAQQHAAH